MKTIIIALYFLLLALSMPASVLNQLAKSSPFPGDAVIIERNATADDILSTQIQKHENGTRINNTSSNSSNITDLN